MKSKLSLLAAAILLLCCCGCRNEPAPVSSQAVSSQAVSSVAASAETPVSSAQPSEPVGSEAVSSSAPVSSALPASSAAYDPSDLAALDNTKIGWGQDNPRNERNQPTKCLTFQEKYGDRAALFLNEGNDVALTFDEGGYVIDTTPPILDTLKEKGVRATFFITQEFARVSPDLVQRMIDEGHVIGNHSWSHVSLPTKSLEVAQSEITRQHDYVKEHFGYEMHLFRPPMGEFSVRTLEMTKRLGYKSVFWSFAYLDYDVNNQPAHDAALTRILGAAHPGAIYLLHAGSSTNAAILGDVIDGLRAKGYGFTVLD